MIEYLEERDRIVSAALGRRARSCPVTDAILRMTLLAFHEGRGLTIAQCQKACASLARRETVRSRILTLEANGLLIIENGPRRTHSVKPSAAAIALYNRVTPLLTQRIIEILCPGVSGHELWENSVFY